MAVVKKYNILLRDCSFFPNWGPFDIWMPMNWTLKFSSHLHPSRMPVWSDLDDSNAFTKHNNRADSTSTAYCMQQKRLGYSIDNEQLGCCELKSQRERNNLKVKWLEEREDFWTGFFFFFFKANHMIMSLGKSSLCRSTTW